MGKVVFINRYSHPDHSATSQLLSDLMAGLAERGLEVASVSSRQRYDDPRAELAASETWRGVQLYRIWTSQFGRASLPGRLLDYLSFYLSLPWKLWGLLRRGDVVVAKTDPPLVSMVVAPVAWLRGAVLVNWLQDVFPEVAVKLGQPRVPRPLAWLLQRIRNLSLRAASANVAIGSRMAEYLVGQGASASSLRTIANWAHEDAIVPMPASASELRASLGWQSKFVVGYSGNLGRAHDIDTLFAAATLLREEANTIFLVVGGGHGYVQLRAQVEAAGLHNIRFLPYQPLATLSDAMAAADLHLVSLNPALEGMIVPSKFYGIAAAARPIGFVGDLDGELARLISQQDCGFSVSPGDGAALAGHIRALAADPALAKAWGTKARNMLDTRFSRENAHRNWHELLLALGLRGQAREIPLGT